MGDENPIRTLGDYSKPSHKGYRNTIELPKGNNVVPLPSDTIRYASSRNDKVGGKQFTMNQRPRNFNKATNAWKDKPNFNWARAQTCTSLQTGSFVTYSSNYQTKLEKALTDFDSHKERRLSSLETQLEQQQDDMISKINNLWKAVSKKLDDTPTPDTARNFMAHMNFASTDRIEKEEEGNVKPSAAKCDDYKRIVEAKKEVREESKEELEEEIEEEAKEEEEEDSPKYFDTFLTMEELGYQEWLLKNPRPLWVKAKIRTGDLNNIKFSCMIGHFDKKQAYLDIESPIDVMSRLHYSWIMSSRLESKRKPSNPKKICNFMGRVRGLKVFIGKFTYKFDFMVLEDTTSVIDHCLGSVVFGKLFVEMIRLVYDMEEGTILFEKDKENIMFKMPNKMEVFKHIDFTNIKTDCIPPIVIKSDDDNCEKAHYSYSLNLRPEYKYDKSVCRAIRSLMKMKGMRNEKGVT
nr:protein kinase-like domain, concanavalin A-like lectin/glucanase domain protein [Tanacetum cinerariifolium]